MTHDGVVIGIYEGNTFTANGEKLNQELGGELHNKWVLSGRTGKAEESLVVLGASKEYPRIAIVGLGKNDDNPNNKRLAAGVGAVALKDNGATGVIEIDSSFGNIQATAEGAYLSSYKYRGLITTPSTISYALYPSVALPTEWEDGRIIAEAQNWARDLAETPANLMTPTIFCQEVEAKFGSLAKVIVRDHEWIEAEQMGLFLGVAQGSVQKPRFIEIHYKNADVPPVVLVGKGITFDSGGISIKPSDGMATMKADMTGAATVVTSVYALAQLGALGRVKTHVIALAPLTENLPSGTATKPGDVHIGRSKKTVEVDNTDAEGRLVLADALDYAQTFNPSTIVDVATLTGAIGIALGYACSGAFTPSDELWKSLEAASLKTSEKMWRMPLFEEYRKQLHSNVADIINASPIRVAGACTAAIFLKEFIKPGFDRWMHLDVAGVMSNNNVVSAIASKGMSAKPMRTLVELVRGLSTQQQ